MTCNARDKSISVQIAPEKLAALREKMSSCCQTPGQTILQHGEAVRDRFKDLVGDRKLLWKLPDWFQPDLINLCPPT